MCILDKLHILLNVPILLHLHLEFHQQIYIVGLNCKNTKPFVFFTSATYHNPFIAFGSVIHFLSSMTTRVFYPYCRESGYLIQNLLKIIKLFKPNGIYNMTMRVKLYGPFLYKKKGRTQHLTSVSSFTQQCFR